MARVTIEDCLEQVGSRFALVHLTSQRVRQLKNGSRRLVKSKNKDIVEALREIAKGVIYASSSHEEADEASLKVDIPDIL